MKEDKNRRGGTIQQDNFRVKISVVLFPSRRLNRRGQSKGSEKRATALKNFDDVVQLHIQEI